jgi:hypothetical protein
MSKQKKLILLSILSVFIFFIPFFWNPVNINIHDDNAIELLHVLRLGDARFTFSLNPSAIYANPLFQILSDDHGVLHSILLYPVFYIVDKLGIMINEPTVTSIYLIMGFLIAVAIFLFSRKIFGQQKAFMFLSLLCSIPYVMMMIKFGWWNFYTLLPFFMGLYFLDDFLRYGKKNYYAFFCLSACLCILSNPGFIFNGLFFIVYALIFLREKSGSWKNTLPEISKLLKNFWTWTPVILIGLEIVAVIIAQKAGYGFGIILHLLSKEELIGALGIKTLAGYLIDLFGLTGFILFPAIFAALVWSIIVFKKADVFLKTSVVFFLITFILLFIFGGGSAYIYEAYLAALLMLIYALLAIKNKTLRYILFVLIVASGLAQAIAYNFNYTPRGILGFLVDPRFHVNKDNNVSEACPTLWCPYHFADIRNVGLKTLGYVARDYLAVSPLPYVSKDLNFHQWENEFFFNQAFYEGPTIDIGRRINYKFPYIDQAKIIVTYTPQMLQRYPYLTNNASTTAAIFQYLLDHPRFNLEALITVGGVPAIEVYVLDGTKPEKIFPAEIYDKLFDQKYSNLKSLSHIDLGAI